MKNEARPLTGVSALPFHQCWQEGHMKKLSATYTLSSRASGVRQPRGTS